MQPKDTFAPPPLLAQVRLLQTTDLHMHLLPYDYALMAPDTDLSFANLRALIAAQRAEGVPTLLCDTGDFLQGNAIADVAAIAPGTHPMIAAFNDLAYDAVVLGNHDFDYGLPALQRALSELSCPALGANLRTIGCDPIAAAYTIVPITTPAGVIQIGLLGLTVPPSPAADRADQPTRAVAQPALDVAPDMIDQMHAAGAEVIVALCHFGMNPDDASENVADRIAALPGIDAVLAGHMHGLFPGPETPQTDAIDPVKGTLHGKPAVMAGAFGRYLGVIDLHLARGTAGWSVTKAQSRVLQPQASPTPTPMSTPSLLTLHEATIARMRTHVATTRVPLSTHFSMIAPDMTQHLLAQARKRRIVAALAETQHANLPVLASAAPYRAGAKDSPGAFLHVTPGAITLNDVMGIYPFQDAVIGVAQTGADLKTWLERSARRFARITPGVTDQPLIDASTAPYDLSSLFGLTYQIDPSQPLGSRISDIRHAGDLLGPDDVFMVATTPYRHHRDKATGSAKIIIRTKETSQDVLLKYLARQKVIDQTPTPVWRFAPLAQTAATFQTVATEPPADYPYKVTRCDKAQEPHTTFQIHFG